MRKFLFICAAVFSVMASDSSQAQDGEKGFSALLIGQRYSVMRDSVVRALNDEGFAAHAVSLPASSEIEVLDFKEDPQLGTLVRIGRDVDLEVEAETASDMWVPLDDLERAGPAWIDFNTFQILDPESSFFKGKMTYCYRDVKKWLLARGICRSYPSGAYAFQGYSILQRECGMRPIGYSANAPVGTVCVSKGGRSCGKVGCGHIAVKVGPNAWYGAGTTRTPWLSARHQPIGCLYKGR